MNRQQRRAAQSAHNKTTIKYRHTPDLQTPEQMIDHLNQAVIAVIATQQGLKISMPTDCTAADLHEAASEIIDIMGSLLIVIEENPNARPTGHPIEPNHQRQGLDANQRTN